MLTLAVYLVLVVVVVAVVYWAVDQLGTPNPLNNIIKVGVVCLAIILVVLIFLQMLGIGTGGLNLPKP